MFAGFFGRLETERDQDRWQRRAMFAMREIESNKEVFRRPDPLWFWEYHELTWLRDYLVSLNEGSQ